MKALIVDPKDNVATALAELQPGERVELTAGNRKIEIIIREPIAYGHKFALVDVAEGGTVIKYGASIGHSSASIVVGAHVHTHNLESERGRGDLP